MRVFVAGATGAIGKRLIPLSVQAGHSVTGMTRSESKAAGIHSIGAEAAVADALDPAAVAMAVRQANPEVIARTGGPVKTEGDPLDPIDPNPPAALRETLRAIQHLGR